MEKFDINGSKIYDIIEPWILDGWVSQYLENCHGLVWTAHIAAHINLSPHIHISTRAVSMSGNRLVQRGVLEKVLTTKGVYFKHLNPLVTSPPKKTKEQIEAIEKSERLFKEVVYGSLLAAKDCKLLAKELLAEVNSHGYKFNSTTFGKRIAGKYQWLIKSRNSIGITYQLER